MNTIKNQKGTAIVEFTIALPVLLALLVGIGEFGHFIYQYNALNKAVRDGTRYLSENSMLGSTGKIIDLSTDPIATKAKNLTVYGNVAGTGTPVLPGFNVGNLILTADGENVQVAASYTYQGVIVPLKLPTPSGFVTITFPAMTASATMGAL